MIIRNRKALALAAACIFLWSTGKALAQKVSKTVPEKGWVLATFSDTSAVSAGQYACFLDSSGATVACGKIIKVGKTVVVIKTSPLSAAAQVKPGFKVEMSGSQPPTATTEQAKGKKSSRARGRIRLVTAPGPGVFSVAKIGYLPPAIGASGVQLWEATDSRIGVEKISAGLEYEDARRGLFGVRYAVYGDSTTQFASVLALQTDYDQTNKQLYVEAAHSVTAFASYYEYPFLSPAPDASSGVKVSAGIDLASATAKVSADLHDESDASKSSLASIKSSLSIVSLRAGIEYGRKFGKSFEVGVGLKALVPLVEAGLKQETTLNDTNSGKSNDEQYDLKKALDHKKSSFGLLIPIYISSKI